MDRRELIEKLNKREIPQSYSSLNHFTSPLDYLEYKLGGNKRQNAGMIFGTLCDCLLLTPEEYPKKYAIVENLPTTDNQVGYVEDLLGICKALGVDPGALDDDTIEDAYSRHYKRGSGIPLYKDLLPYMKAKILKKEVIDKALKEEAQALCNLLLTYDDVKKLFDRITGTQQFIKWEEQGWTMRAYLDFTIPEGIFDLKYSDSADPDEFIKKISNLGYDMQGGTYVRGSVKAGLFESEPSFNWLVYDKTGNYSIIEMDYSYVRYGQRKLDYRIQALNRCVELNAWDQSYNFFNRTYRAFKPKWAKAYVLDGEEAGEL